ncbi:VCBS domain-containing protein [Streptomyces avermitilis]
MARVEHLIHAEAPVQIEGAKAMTVLGFGVVDAAGTWAYHATKDDAALTRLSSGDAVPQR